MGVAPRILVVDDDAAVRRLLETGLSNSGYCVAVACTGHQAMLQLRDATFDLIVLDISLQRCRWAAPPGIYSE